MKKVFKVIVMLAILFIGGCSYHTDKTEKEINVSYDKILKINRILPHNQTSFTEGLFFYNNKLYESVGLYGKSNFYLNINLENGNPEHTIKMADNVFAEGSIIFDDKIYILTYQENKILVYDVNTHKLLKVYPYDKEGWGLTTDGENLIASDGTDQIYYLDKNLNIIKTIKVTFKGQPVNNINELEYIDNYIWANVWQTNYIIIIDKYSGEVVKRIDFTSLIKEYLQDYPNIDSLNGIAYNKNKLYLTGKYYPYIFECTIKK